MPKTISFVLAEWHFKNCSMGKKAKRKFGICVYCGDRSTVTRDHVIPECLFIKPYPPNLITVRACDKCNVEKSKDDDYLRDLLTCDVFGSQNTTAQQIFQDKVLSSQRQNKSLIAREAVTKAKIQPFYSSGGIYLGHLPTFPIDGDRINNLFARITRGLYYDARKQRFPDDYVFEVRQFRPWDIAEVWSTFSKMGVNGPRILGKVFGCAFLSAQEDPFFTWWLLWFYESVFISVSTKPPEPLVIGDISK